MNYTEQEHKYALRKANKIKGIQLLGGQCLICNIKDIHLLEFHHEDKNKENSISQIIDYRWSKLEKEIKKCRLLCSNCHAEYHCKCNNSSNASKNKKAILKELNIFRCSKCGYRGKNFASLDFHHKKPKNKSFGVSKRTKGITIKEALNESKKCLIICKNCHKKQHFDIKNFNRLLPLIKYKILNQKEKPPEYNKKIIWKLYKKGKSINDISKTVGCCSATLSAIIKQLRTKNGMKFRDHRKRRKWKKKEN